VTRTRLALAALLLCLWHGLALAAPGFPPLSGRVVDAANLLDPAQEQALTAKLETLEKGTGRQLVVATIPDLQGYAIEDYGYQLGRAWAIGRKDVNDGVLLIVAPAEKKVRIEVGYGLEPVLTDALSSVIIQQAILPPFREGRMAEGIIAGTDALIAQLQLPDTEAQARNDEAARLLAEQDKGPGAAGFFWFIVMLVILIVIFSNRGVGRRFRGGRAPIVIWGPGMGSGWGSGRGGGFGGGGFSGGGGSFGGGGASGGW
jgi:uncharacterized protein